MLWWGGLGKCCGGEGLASAVVGRAWQVLWWGGLGKCCGGEGLASAMIGRAWQVLWQLEDMASIMSDGWAWQVLWQGRAWQVQMYIYMYNLGIFCVPKSSAHENTKINTIINISSIVVHLFSTAEYAEFLVFGACV